MTDEIERTADQLHDAVDQAIDDAIERKSTDDEIAELRSRIDSLSQPVDLSPIMARLDAMEAARVPVVGDVLDDAGDPAEDAADDADDAIEEEADDAEDEIEDAAEDTADAVDDLVDEATDDDQELDARFDVSTPDIPERPPIKTHPIFSRLFGGR